MKVPLIAIPSPSRRKADAYFNDLKARVLADSGQIGGGAAGELFVRRFFRTLAQYLDFLAANGFILLPEVRKLDGSNVTKNYNLFGSTYDTVKSTASLQPLLLAAHRNGRDYFNYIDGRNLEFAGGALGFRRNKSFLYGAGVLDKPYNPTDGTTEHLLNFANSTVAGMGFAVGQRPDGTDRIGVRKGNGSTDIISAPGVPNKTNRLLSGYADTVAGTLRTKNNGDVIAEVALATGNFEDANSLSAAIGAGLPNGTWGLKAPAAALFGINAFPPAGLINLLEAFALDEYNLTS